MTQKPWDGRFMERTHRSVELFTASIDVDRRLYVHDIVGSIAHARMLAKTGIISDEECSQLIEGLGKIRREIERGEFTYDVSLEDIHMHIENRLFHLVGKAAQKLHTARSRNDQVALDVRLYLREEAQRVLELLGSLRRVIVETAQAHLGVIMPGYTHLQRAQPVLFSHHLMAYYEMLTRDWERFREGYPRIDVMPLGSAALAGTTYPIDREYTASLLGFTRISRNSIDGVSDRDFIIEFLAAASICMVHLSRLSEEIVLWSSSEFRFVELPDAFATGSSIMPQKKNPDVPELVRGKAGRVFGDLVTLLTTMKALPLAYNRDMQEDKAPLFQSVDTLVACLEVYIQMIPRLKVRSDVMGEAASRGYLSATDLADYLAAKGMPFREAHGCAGRAVAYAIEHGRELHELSLETLKSFSKMIEMDVFEVLTVQQMIDRRTCEGGTATENVRGEIAEALKHLDAEETPGVSKP
ncbi:MAG: argininosuccinate lyase [Desulfobacterales bacterium]